MPRVSQAHRDARRRQILDAARRCFARNGFRATSMQDVLAEAGVSAGGLYRYFAGKEDLVSAIAADTVTEITSAFTLPRAAHPLPPFDEVVGDMLDRLQRVDEQHDIARLAVQVWGEAVRTPALAASLAEHLAGARALIAQLVERYRAEGRLSGPGSADAVARVVTGIAVGFMVQRAVLRDIDASTFRAALKALVEPARS
jgi:TetR/AcrR family transcriptional regulator, transcriptional repressor of aconitase